MKKRRYNNKNHITKQKAKPRYVFILTVTSEIEYDLTH